MPRELVRLRWGRLDDFQPWRGWCGGPMGTITDDTQLTMVVAEALVEGRGSIDPEAFVARLIRWLPEGRGVGHATGTAVERLTAGVPWWAAGTASAGNGAAMRTAPVGIAHRSRLGRLRDECIVSSAITHRDATAILASVAQATCVAWCLRNPGVEPVSGGMLDEMHAVIGTLPDPPVAERHESRRGELVRLGDRLRELPDLLHHDIDDVVDHFWNGAYVIESFPVALWAFLAHWDDPEELLIATASTGHDSDTIAAMAGSLAGALHGTAWIPPRWLDQLEYRDELVRLADSLVALSNDPQQDARAINDPCS
jgi:ADP-ribosylglycohydrolase